MIGFETKIMKISAKVDYACRALLELASHWPQTGPIQISVIAKNQKVPMKFLVHILIELKQLGYVDSVRGKMGGYVLTMAPEQIKFIDVVKNLGGLGFSSSRKQSKRQAVHVMDLIWQEVTEALDNAMDQINFETICHREHSQDKIVMYEI